MSRAVTTLKGVLKAYPFLVTIGSVAVLSVSCGSNATEGRTSSQLVPIIVPAEYPSPVPIYTSPNYQPPSTSWTIPSVADGERWNTLMEQERWLGEKKAESFDYSLP